MLRLYILFAVISIIATADHHDDDDGIAQMLGDNVQFRPDTCLEGDKHLTEPKPEPETERHVACHQWKDSACCTPEFTQQLAKANITNIDGFHWNRCGKLSSRCQQFFIDIECFYRCSPNIAHFSVPYPSAFNNLPLCSDYCDDWYDACKDEMTCAVNWIFDWVYVDGINHCKNSTCLSYRSAYGSGRGICETLWGDSFIYADQTSSTPDSERYCLVPSFPVGEDNPNIPALRNIFPNETIHETIAQMLGDNVQFRPDTCLEGDKHLTEPKPEPETERHVACHQWSDSACCTPEFTQQLAKANITNIDGFHWNRCGKLSSRCQQFFIDIECFYRCSPNIAHFSVPYPSAFNNLPLCSDYCDDWYDACKDEMTCAVNWIFDWVYVDGINHCKNSTCLSYRSAYGSGRGICETLWGDSFIYADQTSSTPDSERYCLVPSFPVGEDNPNIPALRNIFPNEIIDGTIAQMLGDNVQFRPDTCLEGDKHLTEPKPEPETERHVACHQWKDSACCTPEFTQQLAKANITNIDGFHWNRCGKLSSRCQQFFIDIECFYRCSPNIAHFSVPYPSAFNNLPLCSDYCDDWYDACKDEMTCAVNWIFDWVYVDGINHCKNSTCLSYRSAYGSGRGICETLWGDSFIYADQTSSTPDSERYCLVPSFPVGEDNPNIPALRNIFPNEIIDETVDDGNGAGHQIVSSVTLLIAAVLFAAIVGF